MAEVKQAVGALEALLRGRYSCREYTADPISRDALAALLDQGQGAQAGSGRRMAPSAHALYPLRLYVVIRRVAGMSAGFYAYEAVDGRLDRMADAPKSGDMLTVSLASDSWLEDAAAVVVIAADMRQAIAHFKDQQPDGMRGVRYVDFESGAVAQNMALAVSERALGGVVVMGFDQPRLDQLLSLPSPYQSVAMYCVGVPLIKQ